MREKYKSKGKLKKRQTNKKKKCKVVEGDLLNLPEVLRLNFKN